MTGLREHWFNTRLKNTQQELFKMIDLHQVYLIFLILSYGMLISLMILILENIMYYYKMAIARQTHADNISKKFKKKDKTKIQILY